MSTRIFVAAPVALGGGGGWPMTVFLTPEQKPFFAGTYFPPEDGHGRPGFGTLIERIAELWENERDDLFAQAEQLTEQVKKQSKLGRACGIGAESIAAAVDQLEAAFDPRFGGFGAAPEVPPSAAPGPPLGPPPPNGGTRAPRMVPPTWPLKPTGPSCRPTR